MAISVDASGTVQTTASSVTSFNYSGITVGSGLSNGALIFFIQWKGAGTVASPTATWDSGGTNQSMTLIASRLAANASCAIFGCVNPIAGNKTLAVSWTTASAVTCDANSYSGVSQSGGTTTWPNTTGAGSSSNSPSFAVTSATGNLPLASLVTNSTVSTVNNTQIYISNVASTPAGAAQSASGAASVTFSATTAGVAAWLYCGCDMVVAVSLPNGQNLYDIRNVQPYWYRSWEWKYNQNLIGKDFMPAAFRKEVYELPPTYYSPNYRRTWEWWYNLSLIGKDLLPNRQQDWPNPKLYSRLDQTWIQDLIPPTAVVIVLPFNQYDWSNPQRLARQIQTWIQSQVPIASVLRPFSQYDWPIPKGWTLVRLDQFGSDNKTQDVFVLIPELHFKPIMAAMGRMGNLGGFS